MPGSGIGPNLANYGSRGRSPSLVSFGENQQDTATQGLGAAAQEETQRNASNTMRAAQAKAGNEQLGGAVGALGGAAAGAEWGSVIGPWGTLIGGVLGAVAGGLFSR